MRCAVKFSREPDEPLYLADSHPLSIDRVQVFRSRQVIPHQWRNAFAWLAWRSLARNHVAPWQRHAAENRRAFGAPHRAGLMSRSVRLTFFRAAGCPFDYEHRPSNSPPFLSLASCTSATLRSPLLSYSYPPSIPFARIPFSPALSPRQVANLLYLATVPPSSRLGCTTPFLSNVVDVPNWSYKIFYLRPILSAGLSTRRSNLNREKIARRNFLRIRRHIWRAFRGYRINRPISVIEFRERTSPDLTISRTYLYHATISTTFCGYVFLFSVDEPSLPCSSTLYVICLASATTKLRFYARFRTMHNVPYYPSDFP